ncbi:MAG: hypothetical protein OEW50_08275, partial [Gammaproteobacteria bacterium]|nr:hypothetical protein [Gammaproteobacteria bacterium]
AQRILELRRQVGTLISAITIHNRGDSIARWQLPICPLVAGVTTTEPEELMRRWEVAPLLLGYHGQADHHGSPPHRRE